MLDLELIASILYIHLAVGDCILPQETECNKVNGQWSEWTPTGICSATCGEGLMAFVRQCNNPLPAGGGSNCTGYYVANETCNTRDCPIDGQWGAWGNWTVCNTTCGDGYQNRSRECDNPEPSYCGQACIGSGFEIRNCYERRFQDDEETYSMMILLITAVSSSCFMALFLTSICFIWKRCRRIKKDSSLEIADYAENGETLDSKDLDKNDYIVISKYRSMHLIDLIELTKNLRHQGGTRSRREYPQFMKT